MTFKDLQKLTSRSNTTRHFDVLKGKPFWIWDIEEHKAEDRRTKGQCCFNHIIGLPRKNDKELPLFDYQEEIYEALQEHKRIWIKKARGLGVSEFMLRYILWLCLRNDDYRNAQIAIITGPRQELAVDLIDRMKRMLEKFTTFDTKETLLELNGCSIKAYPSNANTSRGQPSVKFILLDEADFFAPSEQKIAREAAEGYIGKSDPYIIMVSTPNNPGGLFEQIEKEDNSIYHRLFMPYTKGVGKIYAKEDIEQARLSPSFQREYNLAYGAGKGNIFPYELVEKCLGDYSLSIGDGQKALAVDPAYGSSSKFAILGMEKGEDGILYVKEAVQFQRPNPADMVSIISTIYHRDHYNICLVDDSQAGTITMLREGSPALGRNTVPVRPVNFNKTLSEMTMAAVRLVKEQRTRINPNGGEGFKDLIQQLKAVEFNMQGNPDKKKVSFDLGDCFLMCTYYLGKEGLRFIDLGA